MPGGLAIYLNFAKLCKSYLDVADEDSFKVKLSGYLGIARYHDTTREEKIWKFANNEEALPFQH